MALKIRSVFIFGMLLFIIAFSTCKKSPSDSEPPDSQIPASVAITSPSASQTYWTDQAVACGNNQPDYADKTAWLVDKEPAVCRNGELEGNLAAGQHVVTTRITADGKSIENNVEITVKEGFNVSLGNPKGDDKHFVGDKVDCSATVEPEKYSDELIISVGQQNCADGTVTLAAAGELTARASLSIDGRTEVDEATIVVNSAVAGRVYPLTSNGVAGNASGFTVTLKAGGEVIAAQTDAEGNFAIKSEVISDLGSQEVTLEVAQSGNFYGARAEGISAEGISDGKHSGRSANLQLKAAFTRVIPHDPGTSFYRLRRLYVDNELVYRYLLVPKESRPFQTAFNRAESEVNITASDSTAFWQESDGELDPGISRGGLFTPASLAEVPTTHDGVHVTADEPDGRSSAGVTIDRKGDSIFIAGGHIGLDIDRFGSSNTGTQQHEQAHILGFGHASGWNGQMTLDVFIDKKTEERYTDHSGSNTSHFTVDDVAHIQVYMDALDLKFEQSISFGVLEWMLALDIPGLPPKDGGQKALGKHADFPIQEKIECLIH